jgi:hypothetical protein
MSKQATKERKISLPIDGQSMGSGFAQAHRITIKPAARIRTGDIIVFLNEEQKLIAHRAVRWRGKIRTKGDANTSFDQFGIKKIIGVACTNESWLGKKLKGIQLQLQLCKEEHARKEKKQK